VFIPQKKRYAVFNFAQLYKPCRADFPTLDYLSIYPAIKHELVRNFMEKHDQGPPTFFGRDFYAINKNKRLYVIPVQKLNIDLREVQARINGRPICSYQINQSI
jgi:hypothetical protein